MSMQERPMFEIELSFRKESSKNYKHFLHYCNNYEEVIKYIDYTMRSLSPKYSVFKYKIKGVKDNETKW